MVGWVTAGKISEGDGSKVLPVIIAGLNKFKGHAGQRFGGVVWGGAEET
jgi:hypothetical protein